MLHLLLMASIFTIYLIKTYVYCLLENDPKRGKEWSTKLYRENLRLGNKTFTENVVCTGRIIRSCPTSGTISVIPDNKPVVNDDFNIRTKNP